MACSRDEIAPVALLAMYQLDESTTREHSKLEGVEVAGSVLAVSAPGVGLRDGERCKIPFGDGIPVIPIIGDQGAT